MLLELLQVCAPQPHAVAQEDGRHREDGRPEDRPGRLVRPPDRRGEDTELDDNERGDRLAPAPGRGTVYSAMTSATSNICAGTSSANWHAAASAMTTNVSIGQRRRTVRAAPMTNAMASPAAVWPSGAEVPDAEDEHRGQQAVGDERVAACPGHLAVHTAQGRRQKARPASAGRMILSIARLILSDDPGAAACDLGRSGDSTPRASSPPTAIRIVDTVPYPHSRRKARP